MRVFVDQLECTGSGQCEFIAPEMFVVDDDGLATVIDPDVGPLPDGGAGVGVEVPAQLQAQVRDAIDVCPGACIHLLDLPAE
jgi:ferredoxin